MGSSLDEIMRETQQRIDKINFFTPLKIEDSNRILPHVQAMLDENRKMLYQISPCEHTRRFWAYGYECGCPDRRKVFQSARALAHKNNCYGRIKKMSFKIDELVHDKLLPITEKIVEEDSIFYGGWAPTFDDIINRTRRDMVLYFWNETVKSWRENPYKNLIYFYELGLLPISFRHRINFIDENGRTQEAHNKLIVDIPLDKKQARSNVAWGRFVLEELEPFYSVDESGRVPETEEQLSPEERRILKFEIERRHIHKLIIERNVNRNYVVLSKPVRMERYTLATYIDGENELSHVHYWSEDIDVIRPLIIP